jgi:predicted RNase H-like nuclease (RuvC/YqgF family)
MKRLDQYKLKLKIARSDAKHKRRQMNSAIKSYQRTEKLIQELERKIDVYLARA